MSSSSIASAYLTIRMTADNDGIDVVESISELESCFFSAWNLGIEKAVVWNKTA